jgi:transposase InsO family protein
MQVSKPACRNPSVLDGSAIVAEWRLDRFFRWRTLTWDRGTEMAEHVEVTDKTGLSVYFCDPHSPWQRGTNENTNGLLRQYFPKGTDMSRYGHTEIAAVANALNTRPRKSLAWKTPAEALDGVLYSRKLVGVASTPHTDPTGRTVHITRWTLDRWIQHYREGGFDALVPSPRQSQPRTPAEVFDLARALKKENPSRSAAQIRRILHAQLGWAPDETTIQRQFRREGLTALASGPVEPAVFGRFEADHPNEIWTGDALHGPRIGGRKTYLAFLDDHSRAIVGHRFGFAEDTVRLAAALRPALAARGIPEHVYVDNGSAFVDSWLLRACAKLGIKLAFVHELFPLQVRYSGVSLGCQLGSLIGGGFTPILATALHPEFHSFLPVALLVIGGAVITGASIPCSPRTAMPPTCRRRGTGRSSNPHRVRRRLTQGRPRARKDSMVIISQSTSTLIIYIGVDRFGRVTRR